MAVNRFTLHKAPTLVLMLLPPGILAHHSTAIFDQSKEFSIEGTVIEFVQQNPHARLDIEAVGPNGEMQVYTLDFGNGDRILQAYDLDENSFQPGDRISVTGAPSRFENDTRMLVSSMSLPDGRFADGGSHSGPRQGEGRRTGPPWAVDPEITLPVVEVNGVVTALDWVDPEITMMITGSLVGSHEVAVYEVRAGGATSFYERQNFTPEDFPIGGKVNASGYFIPERGNLIFPHNIWTDTRDLYNQVRAINSAREHLGWPPKEFDRPEGNRPNGPE